jgi:hypothetical protein
MVEGFRKICCVGRNKLETLNDLFEPVPDPVVWLVNIGKETTQIDGLGSKIRWWVEQSPKHTYIGRGSIWGNPFSHLAVSAAEFQVRTRDEAIEKYREYILGRVDLLAQLDSLRGMVLGCWCLPKRCHGEILIELLCR